MAYFYPANMEQMNLLPTLFLAQTATKGRGVFTKEHLDPMTTVEISSVLVMSAAERKLLDQTRLHDYIFEWGPNNEQCCVAWGYVSMYNHSYTANCEYFMDFDTETITVKTVKTIAAGEELTINYNGDWNDEKPIWFEVQ